MPVPDKLSIYNVRNNDMRIPDQNTKIWSDDWKYLIILDACRYDYFEKVYKDYLPRGRLEKVRSCGSTTTEWLGCTFKGKKFKDVVYISANPYINSKGVKMGGFDPRNLHFYKIIDVWDWGWDEKLGTVHPSMVNKATLMAIKLYKGKRFIIHYVQPHYPYIGLISRGIGPKLRKGEIWGAKVKRHFLDRLRGFIRWRLVDLLGLEKGRKIALRIVGPPTPAMPSCVELVARQIGVTGLRKAYEDNLRLVLGYVAKLIKNFHGKIVITADHGELLGKEGMYEHPTWIRLPELIEVPWLEIITI